MAEQNLPPQNRKMALYAAGGGFGGALLAIIVAKILAGPCCCQVAAKDMRPAALASPAVATLETAAEAPRSL